MKKLVIMGAGGHGKVVADIAKYSYEEIVFLDDAPISDSCLGYPVMGGISQYRAFLKDAAFFVALGAPEKRRELIEMLVSSNAEVATLVHPCATVADGVSLGEGTVIMAGAIINPDARIGKGCIVNTSASVDHDCCLGNYVHVAVGAHLAGTVTVGENTWIGAGAIVKNNMDIIRDCIIGAGAVVVKSITQSGTYIGVPARRYG